MRRLALGRVPASGAGGVGHLEVVRDRHGVHARLLIARAGDRRASRAGDGAVTAMVRWWHGAAQASPVEPTPAVGDPGPRAGRVLATWAGEVALGVERQVSTDHANHSVATGEVLVKLLRHGVADVDALVAPAVHLRAVGFAHAPVLLGTLAWEPDGDGSHRAAPVALALAHRYLADAEEGWGRFRRLAQAALQSQADTASPDAALVDLGRLTASFHLAMATPSAVFPTPLAPSTPDDHARWHRQATTLLDVSCSEVAGATGERLRAGAAVLRSQLAPLGDDAASTPLLRIHGDLHVGQVLSADGRLYLTDLDGAPSTDGVGRSTPAPPARDVAAALRSLDHVGRLAAHRTGVPAEAVDDWIVAARRTYLDAHTATLAAAGRRDLLDDRLVAPFEAAQVSHELRYATRWLPAWLPVAADAMDALLEGRVIGGR